MPKRSISEMDWDETSGVQSKIHVGPKEVDQGICSGTNMKAVYRELFYSIDVLFFKVFITFYWLVSVRTLSLLFQGSKGKASRQQDATTVTPAPAAPQVESTSKYSQMVLTPDGKLVQDSNGNLIQIVSSPCKCVSCSLSSDNRSLEQCRFCENFLCQSCSRPCMICSGHFCSNCSRKV